MGSRWFNSPLAHAFRVYPPGPGAGTPTPGGPGPSHVPGPQTSRGTVTAVGEGGEGIDPARMSPVAVECRWSARGPPEVQVTVRDFVVEPGRRQGPRGRVGAQSMGGFLPERGLGRGLAVTRLGFRSIGFGSEPGSQGCHGCHAATAATYGPGARRRENLCPTPTSSPPRRAVPLPSPAYQIAVDNAGIGRGRPGARARRAESAGVQFRPPPSSSSSTFRLCHASPTRFVAGEWEVTQPAVESHDRVVEVHRGPEVGASKPVLRVST